jgi:hypothetical protein
VYDDELIRPYYEHSVGVLDASLFDIHTHTGGNDPDGFRCSADTLVRELAAVGSRAVVMPMHEPAGYPPAQHGRRPRRARARAGRPTAHAPGRARLVVASGTLRRSAV